MKIQEMTAGEALASLRTSRTGLAGEEAVRRLREYGPNRVEERRRPSAVAVFRRDFAHLFAVVLWFSAGLAFLAEWYEPGQGMARVGIAIIAVVLVSGAFSFWQERRVERTLAALRQLLPHRVRAMRDGILHELAADDLVPGDVVNLSQGDRVPADCRVIEGTALRVNLSTITGESAPRARNAEPCHEEELVRSANVLPAGSLLISGHGAAVVFATGMSTEFGRIAHLSQDTGGETSPLRTELAYLSRLIVLLALALGTSFFTAGRALGMPLWKDAIFAIGIFVAMVPEGLLPTLTLALVLAAQRMARKNVLIRHLPAVETLGSTTVIVTDKTGTLTENRMRVSTVALGREARVLDDPAAGPELAARYADFFRVARNCHDLLTASDALGGGTLGDPMEIALVDMAERLLPADGPCRRLGDAPFDTHRMRQSVVCDTPQGPVLYCKGAPETVLPLCSTVLTASGPSLLDDPAMEAFRQRQLDMAGNGLRVLALAARPLGEVGDGPLQAFERELTLCGLAGLEDPPRPEVAGAVRRCREAGIKVIMATGDHPLTALAIARAIGLAESAGPRVISGEELRRLTDSQLQLALDTEEILFARLAAVQKMRLVKALRKKQHVVAVTGDGVNDAPAFRAAHIGIAMGRTGSDVAKESADMVLLDDNFASIVNAIEEGRAIFSNIRKFLTYVLVHNVAELVPYLAFALFQVPLALTPMQILAVDMGTDTLAALGLGVEPPDPAAMHRPPRPSDERLLNRSLALRAYLFLGVMEATAVLASFFAILFCGGWAWGQALGQDDPLYRQATTASLGAIIVMQSVNVFLCRSSRRSVFGMPILGNRLILSGVGLGILLLCFFAYTPWGNLLLRTAPLPWSFWLTLVPFALGMLVLEEARKAVVRHAAKMTG